CRRRCDATQKVVPCPFWPDSAGDLAAQALTYSTARWQSVAPSLRLLACSGLCTASFIRSGFCRALVSTKACRTFSGNVANSTSVGPAPVAHRYSPVANLLGGITV